MTPKNSFLICLGATIALLVVLFCWRFTEHRKGYNILIQLDFYDHTPRWSLHGVPIQLTDLHGILPKMLDVSPRSRVELYVHKEYSESSDEITEFIRYFRSLGKVNVIEIHFNSNFLVNVSIKH